MKRAFKWLGYIVGGLLVLIIIAVGTAYAISSRRMARTYPTQVAETIAIPTDPASIERGRHLARAVGKCQECHGDNLAGKMVSDAPVFARLSSANLTSGKNGIGDYTDADYVRSIRYGVGRNGKPLIFMPSEAYYHFDDADLGAIIAYLKSVPPAELPVTPAKQIGPIARILFLTGMFPLVPAELIPRNQPRPAPIAEGVTAEYGSYLAKTGGCTSCHGPDLTGGNAIQGVKVPNLTPAGSPGKWSEADFFKVIRTGTRPDGRVLSAVMPWLNMKELTDAELRAMWIYLQSVPAKQPAN
ncbi:MAG: c-type cytochrome [Gemmatimonadaceae bacterium]|nr:c-type cytochrome [Gemmatimonadaceae bacterium]